MLEVLIKDEGFLMAVFCFVFGFGIGIGLSMMIVLWRSQAVANDSELMEKK